MLVFIKEINDSVFHLLIKYRSETFGLYHAFDNYYVAFNFFRLYLLVPQEISLHYVNHRHRCVCSDRTQPFIAQLLAHFEISLKDFNRNLEVVVRLSVLCVGLQKVQFDLGPKLLIVRALPDEFSSLAKLLDVKSKFLRVYGLIKYLLVNFVSDSQWIAIDFIYNVLFIDFMHILSVMLGIDFQVLFKVAALIFSFHLILNIY